MKTGIIITLVFSILFIVNLIFHFISKPTEPEICLAPHLDCPPNSVKVCWKPYGKCPAGGHCGGGMVIGNIPESLSKLGIHPTCEDVHGKKPDSLENERKVIACMCPNNKPIWDKDIGKCIPLVDCDNPIPSPISS